MAMHAILHHLQAGCEVTSASACGIKVDKIRNKIERKSRGDSCYRGKRQYMI